MSYFYKICICLIATIAGIQLGLSAQSRQELEKERIQLEKRIEDTKHLLDQSIEQQKSTVENYVALQNQLDARRKMVRNIQDQMELVQDTMKVIEDSIQVLEVYFEELKEVYFSQLRISYLRELTAKNWMYLFSSRNLNEVLQRHLYSRQFQSFLESRKIELDSISRLLSQKQETLNLALDELVDLQDKERRTVNALNTDLKNQDALLNSLRGKEKELKENLKKQERQRKELSKKIDDLIAKEIKRSNTEEEDLPARAAAYELLSGNFIENKGKIPWPVDKGVIQSHFGNQAHPSLKNVTIQNNGIDIRASEGAKVKAVFEGEVTALVSMPGDQKMILVRHGDFFTVYAGLENSYVERGDEVKAGQELGLVGKDPNSGNFMVHFELWREKEMLNPEEWMSD